MRPSPFGNSLRPRVFAGSALGLTTLGRVAATLAAALLATAGLGAAGLLGGPVAGLRPAVLLAFAAASGLLALWAGRHRRGPPMETVRGERALDALIVATVSDAIVLWQRDGTIVFASPSAERAFGRTARELAGRPLRELLAADCHAEEIARRAENGGGPGRLLPLECVRADGTPFPAELIVSEHENGEGPLYVGVFRDVSDRQLAFEAQRRSESLRLMIDGLPDAVMVHSRGRIVYANRAFLEHLGYTSPDAVMDRPLLELVHPDDAPVFFERLRQLERTGKPLPPREERFRARDGRTVTLEMAKVPVDFDGAPSVVTVGRSVAERRLAEERFRAAVESAPSGMIMVDREGRIVLANHQTEAMFGYGPGELEGRMVEDLVPERFQAAHPRLREQFAAHPQARAMGAGRTLHGRRKDGSEVPVEIGLNPIRTQEGPMVLASVVDISERLRSEVLLAAADRMGAVGTLAAGVAHGINNPLAFVAGNVLFAREELEALRSRPELAEALAEPEEALRHAEEGAERIRGIVADLLTYAREENEPQASVDVNEVLRSVISMARNEIRHRARLVEELGEIPPAAGEPSKIAHALTNLIVNATQALPEGDARCQTIRVTTRAEDDSVVVEVADSGPGVPEDQRLRVFDPFFTTKPVGTGTGLGLAVTHGILRSLGGRIELTDAPEGGALFRVTLPVANGATPEPERPPAPDRIAGLRVLLIDDEPRLLQMMQRLLRNRVELTAMGDGREALARLLAGERFDVILCDVELPGMTGHQIYEALQARAPELCARVVFMTGGAFTAGAQEFLDSLPNRVLDKPVDRERLMRALADTAAAAGPHDATPDEAS